MNWITEKPILDWFTWRVLELSWLLRNLTSTQCSKIHFLNWTRLPTPLLWFQMGLSEPRWTYFFLMTLSSKVVLHFLFFDFCFFRFTFFFYFFLHHILFFRELHLFFKYFVVQIIKFEISFYKNDPN